MKVISLGAGVQSSAMLLMALEGRFGDLPDCAVFADTLWEPKAVYRWLEDLEREVAPFPIHRVTAGDIRADAIAGTVPSMSGRTASRFASMPFYLQTVVRVPVYNRDDQARLEDLYLALDDADGDEERDAASAAIDAFDATPIGYREIDRMAGMGRRQCSSEYKIKPFRRWIREHCESAEVWIGISTDEAHRAKPADVHYVTHRWPLLEARIIREACQDYLVRRMGRAAPKSACIGCPFRDDASWARMRVESPEEFADAVAFDFAIRLSGRMRAAQFVHKSLVPLGEIREFRHEAQGRMFADAFGNECEGVCGV